MKKTTLFQIIIFIAVILLGAISLIVLPDSVAVQWDSYGTSNNISKTTAVLIPFLISLFGIASWKYSAVRYRTNIETSQKLQIIHSVIWGTFSCIGVIISVIFIIMN